MSLCRRWWNSCRTSFSSSLHSHLFPSRFIAVPKILPHDVPPRRCRDTQLSEQLVEVPTILTPSFLRMLQNVDIPVPHGGPGHVEQTVDIPDPCSGVWRLQRFYPRTEFNSDFIFFFWNAFLSGVWSRSLIPVVLVEAFKIFAQD